MPDYSYVVRDLFSGVVIDELDLYGVYCTRQMNESGQFQGTYVLKDDDPLRNSSYLNATLAGRYGLSMYRNGTEIWGGIIWSRTYNAQGQNMQIFANTWESYADHMVFYKDHFVKQKVNQENIFSDVWTQLQNQGPNDNIGLTVGTLPVTAIKRTVLIPNYEYHFGTDALSQVVGVDLGLEYTITPGKQILVAAEGGLGTRSATPAMSYDYPGQISNYWLPESGASGAVKMATLGAGAGNKILRAVTVDEDALGNDVPGWWKVSAYGEIADLSVLQAKNVADFKKYQLPFLTPTFDMKPDEDFNQFNEIGSDFAVTIQDVRFPTSTTFRSRLLGWELTPQSNNSPEILKLNIDGSKITL